MDFKVFIIDCLPSRQCIAQVPAAVPMVRVRFAAKLVLGGLAYKTIRGFVLMSVWKG